MEKSKFSKKVKDLSGMKFGFLTVLYFDCIGEDGGARWICSCKCGNKKSFRAHNLKQGCVISCGCYGEKNLIKPTHGMARTRIYRIWKGMRQRCLNPLQPAYYRYGGRGITFSDKWSSFENFLSDMGEGYLEHIKEYGERNTTIDRIDNDGNYEPGNCRWSTVEEQSINKSDNKFLTFKNETKTISEWAKKLNLRSGIICDRLSYNWTVEKALMTPIKKNKPHLSPEQVKSIRTDLLDKSQKEVCNKYNLDDSIICRIFNNKIYRGKECYP